MKFTNERDVIFPFYAHNIAKNFKKAIFITVELMFRLTVSIIEKDKYYEYHEYL